MGGIGSGRRTRFGTRPLVEDFRLLDIGRLKRAGILNWPRQTVWHWKLDGRQAGKIIIDVRDRHSLVLRYRFMGVTDTDWVSVEEPIGVTWTQCHFGGERPWFVCPAIRNGVPCGRRVAKLHGAGRYFACRQCHGLTYRSCNLSEDDRIFRKLENIRVRLGGEAFFDDPFPPKPKGMHWSTYRKIRAEAEELERICWAIWDGKMALM